MTKILIYGYLTKKEDLGIQKSRNQFLRGVHSGWGVADGK